MEGSDLVLEEICVQDGNNVQFPRIENIETIDKSTLVLAETAFDLLCQMKFIGKNESISNEMIITAARNLKLVKHILAEQALSKSNVEEEYKVGKATSTQNFRTINKLIKIVSEGFKRFEREDVNRHCRTENGIFLHRQQKDDKYFPFQLHAFCRESDGAYPVHFPANTVDMHNMQPSYLIALRDFYGLHIPDDDTMTHEEKLKIFIHFISSEYIGKLDEFALGNEIAELTPYLELFDEKQFQRETGIEPELQQISQSMVTLAMGYKRQLRLRYNDNVRRVNGESLTRGALPWMGKYPLHPVCRIQDGSFPNYFPLHTTEFHEMTLDNIYYLSDFYDLNVTKDENIDISHKRDVILMFITSDCLPCLDEFAGYVANP